MSESEDKIIVTFADPETIGSHPQLLITSHEGEKQRVLDLIAILEIVIDVDGFVKPATFILLAKTVMAFITEHQLTNKRLYAIIKIKSLNDKQTEFDVSTISRLASKEADVMNYIKAFAYQVVLVYSDNANWKRIIGFLITITTVLSKSITGLKIEKADNLDTATNLLATAITRDYTQKSFTPEQ